MKFFTPKMTHVKSLKAPKLSSHMAKPAKFSSSKVSIKAPKIGTKRSVGKIKL